MLVFEYQFDAESPLIRMELSPESSLDDIFVQLKNFLTAAGYFIPGDIYFSKAKDS